MRFDEIINNYGKESKRLISSELFNLGDKLLGENKWNLIPGYDSETVTSNSGTWHKTFIAERPLTDNCTDKEYNKAGYVLTVKDMYHEQQHVWQNTRA